MGRAASQFSHRSLSPDSAGVNRADGNLTPETLPVRPEDSVMLPLLAIVCPPLAVLMTEAPSRAVANLGLTLLLYVPGVLNALRSVERHAVERRYATVMRAMELRRA